ncbi:MAG TPA: hypothetical protein VFQ45_20775, partial [Longimicrobium sp.]|nr:hypothetical protein [Longimicrobium sp.]
MLLGGSGLVGMAIAREVLPQRPAQVVIGALSELEAMEGIDALRPIAGGTELVPEWGNLFGPAKLKHA